MSAPSWTEYLSELESYLELMRLVADTGAAPPEPPEPPSGQIPDDCRERGVRLSAAFSQVAVEVSTRMAVIDRRLSSAQRSPHQILPTASFVDVNS